MEYAPTTKQPKKLNNIVFLFLSILIIAGSFLAAISLVFPQVFSVLANMFWIALLVLVVVFLVLGFLVFFGMKKEVSKFLDILLEGSLTIIDAVEFIKKLYFYFIQLVKEFILFITPILAVGTAMAVYLGILVLYKYVGKENDVTLLTIILTAVLVSAVAFLTLPATEQDDIPGEIKETSW
ncbi:hypothetical protein KAZ57_03290, partial [Patescibacteria group bacterium]|nr:hypothetical protein [Patescibacteria group bacterium]